MWWRQLTILVLAFVAGSALAELLGAKNLGTAMGVGQLTFAATLVWVLMSEPGSGEV